MSSHKEAVIAGVDLEDLELTARQYKRLLKQIAAQGSMRGRKPCKGPGCEEDEDEAMSENDDLVNLHEEKKGPSRPPKVTRDDMPKGLSYDDEDEEEDDKPLKKGRKNG